jgi:hypothetical protein
VEVLTQLERLTRQALRLLEAALHQGAIGAEHRGLPEVEGLAQLLRQPSRQLEVSIGPLHVAELEPRQATDGMCLVGERLVSALFRESQHVLGDLEALADVLGAPHQDPPALKEERLQGTVAQALGHRRALLEQLAGPVGRIRPAELASQSAEHLSARRAVLRRKAR